jgi:hypothetical protein
MELRPCVIRWAKRNSSVTVETTTPSSFDLPGVIVCHSTMSNSGESLREYHPSSLPPKWGLLELE